MLILYAIYAQLAMFLPQNAKFEEEKEEKRAKKSPEKSTGSVD